MNTGMSTDSRKDSVLNVQAARATFPDNAVFSKCLKFRGFPESLLYTREFWDSQVPKWKIPWQTQRAQYVVGLNSSPL